VATYRLSWLDAHVWACTERFAVDQLLSGDFEHSRMYATVEVANPFAAGGAG
jgi:predicted nucleic acid-binding protein